MRKTKGIKMNSNVLRLHPLSTPEGRRGNVTLDLNEGYGTLSKKILQKLAVMGRDQVSRYPEYLKLTQTIAKDIGVSPDEVLLTNGSDDAIKMLIDLLFKKRDKVVLPVPTFFIYNHFLHLREVAVQEIPYRREGDALVFPGKEVLTGIQKNTAGVILCNPGNPVGVSVPDVILLKIAKETFKYNIPLIVDEAYIEYHGKSLSLAIKKFPNVILLRTFSKAYGLAGLRIGYVVANKNVISGLTRLRLPWSVNTIAVQSAQMVLKEKKSITASIKDQKQMIKGMSELLRSKGYVVFPTATNFILCKVRSAESTIQSLKGKKVLIKNLTGYPSDHGLLKNVLRITVPSREDYDKVCKILSRSL